MKSSNKKYLTKRLLARKTTEAFKEAYIRAMKTRGFVMVAKDGWVVKIHKDGLEERIEEIGSENEQQELVLD